MNHKPFFCSCNNFDPKQKHKKIPLFLGRGGGGLLPFALKLFVGPQYMKVIQHTKKKISCIYLWGLLRFQIIFWEP